MTGPITIPFSEKWDKLYYRTDLLPDEHKRVIQGDEFHTVRWIDKLEYYKRNVEKDVIVEVCGKKVYNGTITGVVEAVLGELTDEFMQHDTSFECSRKKFYDMMFNWYHKKPEWKGWDSKVIIIFIRIDDYIREGKTCKDCVHCPCAVDPIKEQGKVVGHQRVIELDDRLSYCGGHEFVPKP